MLALFSISLCFAISSSKQLSLALNVCYKSMRICVLIWCSLYQSPRFLHLLWNSSAHKHTHNINVCSLHLYSYRNSSSFNSSSNDINSYITSIWLVSAKCSEKCKFKYDPTIHIYALFTYFLTNDEQTKQNENWNNFFVFIFNFW